MSLAPRAVVILVGTDHHRFDRVVEWADRHQAAHPEEHVFVQYGQSNPPARARGASFLSPPELKAEIAGADVVITHGGPGTIHDARSAGHRPIVLPRDPRHGEHVDDHQQRFGAWCHERGLVRLARTVDDLDPILSAMSREGTRVEPTSAESRRGVALVEALSKAPARRGRRSLTAPGAPTLLNVSAATDLGTRSTLEDALSQIPGALVLGSVADVWTRGLGHDDACACGQPFSRCTFWRAVGEKAYGGWDHIDPDELRWLTGRITAGAGLGSALRHPGRLRRADLLRFAGHQRRVLEAALGLSGAAFVVDTSDPMTVLALSHDRHLDVIVLAGAAHGSVSRIAIVAAANHRRLPVLAVSARPTAAQLQQLAGFLGLAVTTPATGMPAEGHGPDVRIGPRAATA